MVFEGLICKGLLLLVVIVVGGWRMDVCVCVLECFPVMWLLV